jgi:hypothetical protein
MAGEASLGIGKDVARGFELLREAVAQPGFDTLPGYGLALLNVAWCYLYGEGVEKDAVHGVCLLRQVITQGDEVTANAQAALATCYSTGDGVDVDLKQATKWSSRAAAGGYADAIQMLEVLRTCDFCGTPDAAKQWCERCRKVRYCNATCQRAH